MGLGRVGDVCVAGFNRFADGLHAIGEGVLHFVPSSDFLSFYQEQLTKNSKTFFIKPVAFINSALKYFEETERFKLGEVVPEGLRLWSFRAGVTKSIISSIEIFAKTPAMLAAFSAEKPLKAGEEKPYAREFIVGMVEEGQTSLKIQKTETFENWQKISRRAFNVANWLISCCDAINELKNYYKFPSLVDRVTLWVQVASGLYMGGQGLCEEGRIFKKEFLSAQEGKEIVSQEKWYSLMTLATNVSCVGFSLITGLGTHLGVQAPKMLQRAHFCGLTAVMIMPIIQAYAKNAVEALRAKSELKVQDLEKEIKAKGEELKKELDKLKKPQA